MPYLRDRSLEVSLWARHGPTFSVVGTAFIPLFVLMRQGRAGVVSWDSVPVLAPGERDALAGRRVGVLHVRLASLGQASCRRLEGKVAALEGQRQQQVVSLLAPQPGVGWGGGEGIRGRGIGLVSSRSVEKFIALRKQGRVYGIAYAVDRRNPPLDVGYFEPPGGWVQGESKELRDAEGKVRRAAGAVGRVLRREGGTNGAVAGKNVLNDAMAELSQVIKTLGEADAKRGGHGQAERWARRGIRANALTVLGVAELLQLPLRIERGRARAAELEAQASLGFRSLGFLVSDFGFGGLGFGFRFSLGFGVWVSV